jgi:hypothetical protein
MRHRAGDRVPGVRWQDQRSEQAEAAESSRQGPGRSGQVVELAAIHRDERDTQRVERVEAERTARVWGSHDQFIGTWNGRLETRNCSVPTRNTPLVRVVTGRV